ncbi:MAG: MFS transporter [Clostridiales bacterium]|nr:MFS transporter [Clostridiales bacterium]
MAKKGVFGKVTDGLRHIKKYWRSPPDGKYLSYKEFSAFSFGGIGVYGGIVLASYITLSAGYYLAAVLGIDSDDIWLISMITSVVTIVRAPLISKIIDNTNTKYGKFRPYLMSMPAPIFLLTMLTVWLTPLFKDNYTVMLIVFAVLFNLQQTAIALYNLAFTTLAQVVSPSQNEREMLMGVGASIYSLGSSAVNFLFPLIANLIFTVTAANGEIETLGVNTIGAFNWVMPIMLLAFFAAGYWMAFGTKERSITSKSHSNRVGLKRGLKETSKNKYFWLNTSNSVLGFAKVYLTTFITVWICTYMIKTEWAQSLITTVIGISYTPAMLGAPFLLKKFGKKNLVIASNIIFAVLGIPMVFLIGHVSPYVLIAAIFIITFFNAIQIVTPPALSAQINDYQQFKTGERMEGVINQFGSIINTAFGIGFGLILPFIYHKFNLFGDYSVLNDHEAVLFPILRVCTAIAAASAAACAVPMFFWDLSEKKHDKIIDILKLRADAQDGAIDKETAAIQESRLLEEYKRA